MRHAEHTERDDTEHPHPGRGHVCVGSGGPADPNSLGATVYRNFALTDDAVIFFIGQGMWVYEAAGPQKVSVPRTELASVLA